MGTDYERLRLEDGSGPQKSRTYENTLWPRLIELWIFGSIAIFFLLRILGSHYGQRVLGLFRNHLQQ